MTDKELVSVAIEHFGTLQRIKQANGSQDNPVLDHELKLAAANLSSYGIKVEDITLV